MRWKVAPLAARCVFLRGPKLARGLLSAMLFCGTLLAMGCGGSSEEPAAVQTPSSPPADPGEIKLESKTGLPRPQSTNVPQESVPAKRVSSIDIVQKFGDGKIWTQTKVTKYSDDTVKNHGPYLEFYADGGKFIEGNYAEGQMSGKWIYWHPNGKKAREGSFEVNRPEGQWRRWREDGTLEWIENYRGGVKDGEWIKYSPDGQTKLAEENYLADKKHGKWVTYYDDGKLKEEVNYVDGKFEGELKQYFPSGKIRLQGTFKNGLPQGAFSEFNEKGELIRKVEHSNS